MLNAVEYELRQDIQVTIRYRRSKLNSSMPVVKHVYLIYVINLGLVSCLVICLHPDSPNSNIHQFT